MTTRKNASSYWRIGQCSASAQTAYCNFISKDDTLGKNRKGVSVKDIEEKANGQMKAKLSDEYPWKAEHGAPGLTAGRLSAILHLSENKGAKLMSAMRK